MLEARGYEVIESRALQQAIRFDCYDDVQAWAIDSGWLVNGQDRHIGWRIAGGRALLRAGEIFLHPLYPIHATSEMSIVLAQKPLECESAFAPRSGYIVNSPAESGRNPELDPVAWPDSVTALPETARTSAQSG